MESLLDSSDSKSAARFLLGMLQAELVVLVKVVHVSVKYVFSPFIDGFPLKVRSGFESPNDFSVLSLPSASMNGANFFCHSTNFVAFDERQFAGTRIFQVLFDCISKFTGCDFRSQEPLVVYRRHSFQHAFFLC